MAATGHDGDSERAPTGERLGLPLAVTACLFDLDGVLTSTEQLHAKAWKETFDAFLSRRSEPDARRPFDADEDYRRYVDGRLREDGVRTFLASRKITLPDGGPKDGLDDETVQGVANAKNARFLELIKEDGVQVYPGAIRFLRAARGGGQKTAVVTASANAEAVLHKVGIRDLIDVLVDGAFADSHHLAGKPAPDTYLAGAKELGVAPDAAAVFEDARSGVDAARAGGFGFVVAVAREHNADQLRAEGADVVVSELDELLETP